MAARLGRSGSPQDSMEATDADRSPRDHAAGRADDAKLFASLELSQSRWLVTVSAPGSEKLSKHAVSGGDGGALLDLLARLRATAGRRGGVGGPGGAGGGGGVRGGRHPGGRPRRLRGAPPARG